MNLNYVREKRGLPFVKRGMRVELSYAGKIKKGVVTSGNTSGNINVRFDSDKHSENCHPRWAIKYFDGRGNVLAEFPE